MDEGRRESALEQAAATGDVARLREAAASPDIDDEEARAESLALALQICCDGCHWDAVRFLVEEGGVDLACPELASIVLQHAAAAGRLDVLELAIAHGADLTSEAGSRAALSAAVAGQFDTMRYAVDRGADVRAEGGRAALSAAKAGRWQASEYLVAAGGDLEPDGVGVQLLALAAVSGQLDITRALEERDMIVASPAGAAALLAMGSTQEWDTCYGAVRYLVEKGADVRSEAGGRALLSAAMYGDIEMVRFLAEHGVELRSELGGEAVARAGELGPADSAAPVTAFLTAQGAVAPPPQKLVIDEDF